MLINARKKDVIWNYLGIFFNLCTGVLFLPAMIHYLPSELIGLWYVFISIGAIVQLFDFGFNPTISHCVTYAWSGASDLKKEGVVFSASKAEPNFSLLCGVMHTCRYLYLRIALLATFIMLTFGSIYIYHVAFTYISTELLIAWLIYIAAIFTNLYIGYYSVVLIGIGDVFSKNKAGILSKAIFIIIGIVGLVLGYGLLALSVSYFICGFMSRYLSRKYLFNHSSVFQKISNIDTGKYTIKYILGTMWHNAWRDGLVTVTAYLTGQATVLLSGLYLGLDETGIYSVSMEVINVLLGIASGMFVAHIPALQSCYVTRNIDKARVIYQRGIYCFYFMAIAGVIGFLLVGVPIVQIIRHDFMINRLDFIMLAMSMFLMTRHRHACWLISTWNTLPYTFAFILFGILSVISTYIGLAFFHLGILGLIWIPMIIESLYNNWNWVVVVNRFYNITELDTLEFGIEEVFAMIRKKII